MKKPAIKIVFTIIEAVIVLALGILTIIFAKDLKYWGILGYISGALIILDGIFQLGIRLFGKIVAQAKISMIRGTCELTLGIFILFVPEIVVEYFSMLVSIAMCVCGFMGIVEGIIDAVRHSKKTGKLVLQFIISAILIALGVVAIVFYPDSKEHASGTNTISVLLIIVGVLFIISSLVTIGYMIGSMKKGREEKDKIASEIAEARQEKRESKK